MGIDTVRILLAGYSNPAQLDTVTYQGQSGWFQVGGTSLASPIIASTYVLAGNGTSTVDGSYPYAHTSSLFDVTSGTNGTCSPAYLCAGEVGYDVQPVTAPQSAPAPTEKG